MVLSSEESETSHHSVGSFTRKLWPFFKPYKKRLFVVLILVLVYVILGRSLPFVVQHAIDEGLVKKLPQVVLWMAGLYLVLDLFRSMAGYFQSYLMQRLGNRVLFDLRSDLMLKVESLPLKTLDKTPSGRLLTRVTNDTSSLGELFTEGFTDILVNIVEMTSIVIALMLVSAPLSLVIFIFGPFSILISLKISHRIRYYFFESKKKVSAMNSFTAETLNGLKVVQSFNQEAATYSGFAKLSSQYKDLQLKTVGLFALLWPVIEAFNIGTIFCALLFGWLLHSHLGLSIGDLSAFILLLQSFFRPLRSILERFNQMQNALSSGDRIFSVLEMESENLPGDLKAERLHGNIEFQDVSFRYGDSPSGPLALNHLSAKIKAGTSVALVGRTGSGKTTFVSLLQRLYTDYEGKILVDGRELSEWNGTFLRQRIGVVLQDAFLFKGSLKENLSMGDSSITDTRVQEVIAEVGLKDLGYTAQSAIDEKGENLSAGERQLVGFARVLLYNPDILILDEATAHVDSTTEARLQNVFQRVLRGRTSLIIAHRLSTVQNCDQILVLAKGECLESGSHHELMAKNGVYAHLTTQTI